MSPPLFGSTITIRTDRGRRLFSVARNETGGYLLKGARGATYLAVRFRERPTCMFLMTTHAVDPLGANVVLTDQDGPLCQVETMGAMLLRERDGRMAVVAEATP